MKKGLIIGLAVVLVFGLAVAGMAYETTIDIDTPILHDVFHAGGDLMYFEWDGYVDTEDGEMSGWISGSSWYDIHGGGGSTVNSTVIDNRNPVVNFAINTFSTSAGPSAGMTDFHGSYYAFDHYAAGTVIFYDFESCASAINGDVQSSHLTVQDDVGLLVPPLPGADYRFAEASAGTSFGVADSWVYGGMETSELGLDWLSPPLPEPISGYVEAYATTYDGP